MKRLLLCLLLLSGFGLAQTSSAGSITAQGATCATTLACVSLHFPSGPNFAPASASIVLTGTFTATAQFEVSADNGTTWVAVLAVPQPSGAAVSSATATGTWTASVAAATDIRVRVSAYTSGTVAVTLQASAAVGQGAVPYVVTVEGPAAGTPAFSQNLNKLWGITIKQVITTSQVTYNPTTADNTANLYDIGIFDSNGNLLVHIGATAGTTFAPNTTVRTQTWLASATLLPGRYYVGITTNCAATCATVGGVNTAFTFLGGSTAGATSGGVLSSTITPPADSWNTSSVPALALR